MNHVTHRLIVGVVTAAVGSLAAAAAVASPATAGIIVNQHRGGPSPAGVIIHDLRDGPTAAVYPPGPTAAVFLPGPYAAGTHEDEGMRSEGFRNAIIPCL